MLNLEDIPSINPGSELPVDISDSQFLLTQEMVVLTAQSEAAFGAADQVSISHKILDLAEKIRSVTRNERF